MADYSDSVFINCPFDEEYQPFLRAIVFSIYRTGFYPRCAMEEDNGLQFRLTKILNIIEGCKYGFHDISRVELNENDYPRFNMPFELGLFGHANTSAKIKIQKMPSYLKELNIPTNNTYRI